jgi:hypothetical protein
MPLEIVEPPFPQHSEGFGPIGDKLYRLRPKPPRAALCVPSLHDQAGILEHLEMLGDGRLRQPEWGGEFAYCSFTIG